MQRQEQESYNKFNPEKMTHEEVLNFIEFLNLMQYKFIQKTNEEKNKDYIKRTIKRTVKDFKNYYVLFCNVDMKEIR